MIRTLCTGEHASSRRYCQAVPWHVRAPPHGSGWEGAFPDSIDIIAKAHYRTLRYGRKINVFNRIAPSEHTIKVGPITVTTPVRTACDLALNCAPETESKVSEIICMLMQEFHFRPNDCMQIMEDTKHIRNAPQARNYILAIDGRGYEHGNRKDYEDRKDRKDAEYVRGA